MATEKQYEIRIPIASLRRVCGAEAGEIEALVRSRQIPALEGQVSLVSGVRAYLDHVRGEARDASLTVARDAAQEARAEAVELDLDMDERRLLPDIAAENALAELCGAITSAYQSIAARATRDMVQRREIEGALYDAQGVLAQAVGQQAEPPASNGRRKAAPRRKGVSR